LDFAWQSAAGSEDDHGSLGIEFRSPLAEFDHALQSTMVLCQREGSAWSTKGIWSLAPPPFGQTSASHVLVPCPHSTIEGGERVYLPMLLR
jgi:hypothetical protein